MKRKEEKERWEKKGARDRDRELKSLGKGMRDSTK